MQALIVERISKLGKCEIINGSMSSIEKQERMNNFRMDPDIKFICCTDAANYGVNLQQANLLVNFEVPWNPAVWQQRNARIHRINSDHDNINIINLIAKGGLDEKILDVLYDKQNIASSVIEKRDNEKRYLNKLTNSVMTKVLK
jgi:SNF2 family DNA or RNA helicase